jgi:hypothetical protein
VNTIEAPTDAQLGYIASLCADRDIPLPAAIHSKTEASEIIDGIRTRTYDPRRYRPWKNRDEAEWEAMGSDPDTSCWQPEGGPVAEPFL